MTPSWILVGGVTSVQDARLAEALGADAISLVLRAGDPRQVRLDMAAEIAHSVTIETVIELTNPDPDRIRSAVLTVEPSRLQLHAPPTEADPPPLPWFRSFRCEGRQILSVLKELPCDRFLLEVPEDLLPGGRKWQRDRTLLREVGRMGAMILGGVKAVDELPLVMEKARPWGVRLRACVERAPGWVDVEALDKAMRLLRGRSR